MIPSVVLVFRASKDSGCSADMMYSLEEAMLRHVAQYAVEGG